MNPALISIIVPVYNVSEYIAETIESVRRQTYENWELLLVNDGSTDNSGKICKSYLYDDRIRYIEIKNSGACVARNKGLDNSKGNYIYFLDADDLLLPNCLEFLLLLINKYDVDIAGGQAILKKGDKVITNKSNLHKNDIVDSNQMILDLLNSSTIGSIWGRLYRKEILNNIRFHPGLKRGQDINFLWNLFLSNKNLRVYRSNQTVEIYRIVSNSISRIKLSNEKKIKRYINSIKALDFLIDKYKSTIRKSYYYEFSNVMGRFLIMIAILTNAKFENYNFDFNFYYKKYCSGFNGEEKIKLDKIYRLPPKKKSLFIYKIKVYNKINKLNNFTIKRILRKFKLIK